MERLKIEGQRPTESRFKSYKLQSILEPYFNVLDIGCNCGFFCIHISSYVKMVYGIEPNKTLIDVANLTKEYLNIKNCKFYQTKLSDFKPPEKYDLILSLAVHKWVKMSFDEYVNRIRNMLNKNGYLFIESHHLEKYDTDWRKKINMMKSQNFIELWEGDSSEVGRPRKFSVLRFT